MWQYDKDQDKGLQSAFDFMTSNSLINWFDTADSYGTGTNSIFCLEFLILKLDLYFLSDKDYLVVEARDFWVNLRRQQKKRNQFTFAPSSHLSRGE